MHAGRAAHFDLDASETGDIAGYGRDRVFPVDAKSIIYSDLCFRSGSFGAPAADLALRNLPLLARLLTPILGTQATVSARILLERFGSIAGIINASDDALAAALEGDLAAADALLAARELMQLGIRDNLAGERVTIGNPHLTAFLVSELENPQEERLVAVFLDHDSRFIRAELIGRGSRNCLSMRTRSLMKRVLELNAGKFIIAHNHPSGALMPSELDRQATSIIEDIARGLGVELVDHCIVARGQVLSMRSGKVL